MINVLYYGDNLDILRNKIRDETVDLCYIDPPFNSKRNYFQIYNNVGKDDAAQAQAFMDTWTWNELAITGFQEIITNYQGRYTRQTIELLKGLKAVLGDGGLLAYLISMTQRINEIQRVLKPTGSFYLHCDPTASHYLKLVLDGVFCSRGGDFKSEIVWKRHNARPAKNNWPHLHDILLFFTKSNKFYFSPQRILGDIKKVPHTLITGSDGKKYQTYELTAPMGNGNNPESERLTPWRGYDPRKYKRQWGYLHTQLDVWANNGFIHFPKNNGFPRRLDSTPFISEERLIDVGDTWTDIDRINQAAKERLGYPTQKPEALLERIIQASSNEGDTVLDAYCGCGTSVAVAQRLRRNWIGIDITYQSIAVILKRLEDSFGAAALDSVTLDGIPRDMDSARALANKKDDRVRKEFEKWVLLTYSKNRATINEKKGADKGIDGTAYFVTGSDTTDRVIFQVKSGKVQRNDIATLNSDRQRENAELAVLITLEESTKPMRDEALAAGIYHHVLLNRDYAKIQIVTIQEMLEQNKRIDLPLGVDVLKSAAAATIEQQQSLL